MKFSVITVCRNSAETLPDTLHSVARQTWPHVEHIVIDGASTDGTQAVLEEYRHGLAHVVCEPDSGIYDAMNKGLRIASGDVICFLNADDIYMNADVLTHVAALMSEEATDAVFGDVVFCDRHVPDRVIRRYRSGRFRPDRLAWGWMPAHPAMFIRRKIYERLGGFRTDYRIAGDFEFVVRAFTLAEMRYKYAAEVFVKMRAGGISTAGLRSKLVLNREVVRACRDNGLSTNMLKVLSKYPAKLLELAVR